MVKYKGINHLAMVTGNLDMTIRFWRDLLGMRLVAGLGREGYRHYFFEISENDLIAFFEWPGVEPIEPRDHGYPTDGPVVFDHISFGVEGPDELWELKDNLAAAGFWTSEIVDHGFIHSLYSFDPNGIPIEFSYNVAGMDIRRNPRMRDLEPGPVAREGAEPKPGIWPRPAEPTPVEDRRIYPGAGAEAFSADDYEND